MKKKICIICKVVFMPTNNRQRHCLKRECTVELQKRYMMKFKITNPDYWNSSKTLEK
jgi:hypothetical protein